MALEQPATGSLSAARSPARSDAKSGEVARPSDAEPIALDPADSFHHSAAVVRFDAFLFAAAATVLITRSILKATGYPQVGSSSLHIAHVLWGGLLLAVGMTIMMVALASPARFWASLLGGIGFGLFIDEVGKFVTKDVNYFYRPAAAIIYAVLIGFYMIGREVIARRPMRAPQIRALGAQALADQALGLLTEGRRKRTTLMLRQLPPDEFTDTLIRLLDDSTPRPRRSAEEWLTAVADRARRLFLTAARHRWVRLTVFTLMSLQAVISLVVVGIAVVALSVVDNEVEIFDAADFASLGGTAVQSVFIVAGLLLLARHRWTTGLQTIRIGLFVALMFSTVMQFSDEVYLALANFVIIAILLAVIGATTTAVEAGELGPKRTRAPV